MKKVLSLILAAALVILLPGCGGKGESQPQVVYVEVTPEPAPSSEDTSVSSGLRDIVILYTNDVHCGINDNLGYADLATVKKLWRPLGKPSCWWTAATAFREIPSALCPKANTWWI